MSRTHIVFYPIILLWMTAANLFGQIPRNDAIEIVMLGLLVALLIVAIVRFLKKKLEKQATIKNRKDKIAFFWEFFRKILKDEVQRDSKWPDWALVLYDQHATEYYQCHEECKKMLDGLPTNANDIYNITNGELDIIQEKLDEFDIVDRELTKIREDVKFYEERASEALAEARRELREAMIELTEMESNHITTGFNAELQRLREILADLGLKNVNDYRKTFEKSLSVAEKAKVVQGQMRLEEELRVNLGKKKPEAENTLVNEAPKLVSEYGRLYGQITQNFSGASIEDLIPLAAIEGFLSRAKTKLDEVSTVLSSTMAHKYKTASRTFVQAQADLEAIRNTVYLANEQLEEIEGSRDSFDERVEVVRLLVKEATKVVKDSDVKKGPQDAARTAVTDLENAIALSRLEKPDWLGAKKALDTAEELAQQAIEVARKNIKVAKKSRYSSNYSSPTTHTIPTTWVTL